MKLIAADVKTGLAIAKSQLESIEVDGVEYFMHPEPSVIAGGEVVGTWKRTGGGSKQTVVANH